MKDLLSFLLGIALTIIGGFLFLNNISVSGFTTGWYSMGSSFHVGTNTITVIVIIMIISFVSMILYPNFITRMFMVITSILFIISIVLSLRFNFKRTNAFVVFMILAAIFGGLALILKAALGIKKNDDKKN